MKNSPLPDVKRRKGRQETDRGELGPHGQIEKQEESTQAAKAGTGNMRGILPEMTLGCVGMGSERPRHSWN